MNYPRLYLTLIIFFFAACSESDRKTFLQEATGRPGDVIIIMDSLQWKGPVANELRNIFSAYVDGLPRPQPQFDAKWVQPSDKIGLIKQVRSLVMVFTLDQHTRGTQNMLKDFSQSTLDSIRSDTSFYLSTAEDEYARGQTVMYLFGKTQESLAHHLQQNGSKITDYFKTLERERLVSALERTTATRKMTEVLRKELKCSVLLPVGYQEADKQKNFIWFRQVETETDQSIFIAWKPYSSPYQLQPDSLITWRDEIARQHLFEDPDNRETYMITETSVPSQPVNARQININGNYAMEIRGLWKIPTAVMGGPFVGCGLVDKERGLLYYIEGFTYSPGKDQREIIRQLEAILYTFRTSNQLSK